MIDKKYTFERRVYGGLAQLVERQLCKLDVRSSILLASKERSFRDDSLEFIDILKKKTRTM